MIAALYFVLQSTPWVGAPATAIGVYSTEKTCGEQGEAIVNAYGRQHAKTRCDPAPFYPAPVPVSRPASVSPSERPPAPATRAP